MARGVGLALLALGWAAPAVAQEWTAEARATAAVAMIDDETPLAPGEDDPVVDLSLEVGRSDTFDNGLTLTWRGEARLQRDARTRPAFAGVLGDCSPALAACPRAASGAGFLTVVSPATGLAYAGGREDEEFLATIEGASVALSGPWGEGVLGLESGAASQLDARAPRVLEEVSAVSPTLDPTGLVTTRARNDVTGPSFKATYFSPRWLGFRVGGSWTPTADQRGADFDPDFGAPGQARAELENVFEGALSFARQFAQAGVRVRAAITATMAESGSRFPEFGDYEAWGAGLELEKGAWTGGLRWLSSDNAWAAGNGDYEAWEVGLVRQGETWRFGVEAGWSTDDLGRIEGSSWLVGLSRKVNDNVRLGLAWVDAEADLPVSLGTLFGHTNARNDGLVVELSVGKW